MRSTFRVRETPVRIGSSSHRSFCFVFGRRAFLRGLKVVMVGKGGKVGERGAVGERGGKAAGKGE